MCVHVRACVCKGGKKEVEDVKTDLCTVTVLVARVLHLPCFHLHIVSPFLFSMSALSRCMTLPHRVVASNCIFPLPTRTRRHHPHHLWFCCCFSRYGVHSLLSNNIGTEGAAVIAEALRSNSALQNLSCVQCCMAVCDSACGARLSARMQRRNKGR